ncbi:MAG: hypothetical protein IH898_12130 [Planctomycetes bacterium]|nr:hypothetical protein [Planctomycetota bacterium]
MKFAMIPLAIACAILWGGAVFLCGTANMLWPPYGESFLQLLDSIYPGYHASGSFGSVVIGTLYAIVDGAVGGLVFGLLYNFLVGKCGCHQSPAQGE